jgi:uncharacterized membrane protein YfcA
MQRTLSCPYFRKAFAWCVPIGGLGGLIGLGGGEFRLPVLMYAIGFDARSAIPLNLVVSVVTLAFAMVVRAHFVSMTAIGLLLPEILGLATGGAMSAFYGAHLVKALSTKRLVQLIACLLAGIGCLLLIEAARPFQHVELLPAIPGVRFGAGACIGLGIGLVSSVLGVAGGELLIPTLIFIFGADIKTAGSASIMISLVVVVMGLWRHWRLGVFPHGRGVQRIAGAMSAGSIIGAIIGGIAVAYAPVMLLKLLLGCVLIAAAIKTVTSHR